MVGVLVSSTEDRGFDPVSDRTKDYKIVICCYPRRSNHTEFCTTQLKGGNKDNINLKNCNI
jgi:hypothetical protein